MTNYPGQLPYTGNSIADGADIDEHYYGRHEDAGEETLECDCCHEQADELYPSDHQRGKNLCGACYDKEFSGQ